MKPLPKLKEIERIRARAEALEKKRPGHKEIIEFFSGILIEQCQIKSLVKKRVIDADKEVTKAKNEDGLPLVDKKGWKVDGETAAILFNNLAALISKRNKEAAKEVGRIRKALKENKLKLEELFQKMVSGEEEGLYKLAENLKLNGEILALLIRNSIRPIIEVYADQMKKYIDQEKWQKNYCPLCGSKPGMAELEKEKGKRLLSCSLCGQRWQYARLKCPYCGNDDHKELQYFYLEKDSRGYRIDVCKKCKKCIKTLDRRQLGEDLIPLLEDVGTLHLDLVAQKEGYTREPKTFFN